MNLPANTPKGFSKLPLCSASITQILNNNDSCHLTLAIGENPRHQVHLFYLDGMVSRSDIGQMIIRPLMVSPRLRSAASLAEAAAILESGVLYFPDQRQTRDISQVISMMHVGFCALVFDELNTAFLYETKGFERRGVSTPQDETVVKGAKDAFNETIRANTATLRRKIGSPHLKMANLTLGTESKTTVILTYLDDVANPELVQKVRQRLEGIETDQLLSLGAFEELFLPKPRLFPKLIYTERPDKFCACLTEGRVGILIDGFPIGYIVPVELNAVMQTPEGYAHSPVMASATRILLYLLLILSLSLPAFYVAVVTHHPELLPLKLALSLQHSRVGVPFPAFLEVLLLLIAFEILIEAGMRLPKSIGQAVSIVGGLIIGDAVVGAVVVVGVAALAALTVVGVKGFIPTSIPAIDFHAGVDHRPLAHVLDMSVVHKYKLITLYQRQIAAGVFDLAKEEGGLAHRQNSRGTGGILDGVAVADGDLVIQRIDHRQLAADVQCVDPGTAV